jgi:tetratricopeptide (TPR) repeat protein
MGSIFAVLVGALLFILGAWILLQRLEGFVEYRRPRTVTIGDVTIDGTKSKPHAELLRARFDHHFRRPAAIPSQTGFLEVATLDAQELFQPKGLEGGAAAIDVEVSGVSVTRLVQVVNELAKPAVWLVEGDFQTRPDRILLALRLRRGPRVLRTWYLDRVKEAAEDQPRMLERLTDDAIFQLVYDFWNAADPDLARWRGVVRRPRSEQYGSPERPGDVPFPSAAAAAAYYDAQGALARYFALGNWKDLDVAIEELRTLRVQMPEFVDGLQLLGIALAEKGQQGEAIHVYEHLRSVLEKLGAGQSGPRLLAVRLLKATATSKLQTWQSAHEAVRELRELEGELRSGCLELDGEGAETRTGERAACRELLAHCRVQLAHTYALYLEYLTRHTMTEVLGNGASWLGLSAGERRALLPDSKDSSRVVIDKVTQIADMHRAALREADGQRAQLEPLWETLERDGELRDANRRKGELRARLALAAGYGAYHMAQWERSEARPGDGAATPEGGAPVFQGLHEIVQRQGPTPGAWLRSIERASSEGLLEIAKEELRKADASHPNHYVVLQLLGQAYSDPRDRGMDLSVAEQYFERAIRANPSDARGHELLATILLRRVARRGIEWGAQDAIKKGLAEAERAIGLSHVSYTAHLRHAEFQAMLVVLETNAVSRRELLRQLEQYAKQAKRFSPPVFHQPDPDLAWVDVVAEARRLGEEAEGSKGSREHRQQRLDQARAALKRRLEHEKFGLIKNCKWWEEHWVPHERVVEIAGVRSRATALLEELGKPDITLENWAQLPIPFFSGSIERELGAGGRGPEGPTVASP